MLQYCARFLQDIKEKQQGIKTTLGDTFYVLVTNGLFMDARLLKPYISPFRLRLFLCHISRN